MKRSILFIVAAILITTIGCRKIEMDGEKEVIIVNQGGGGTTVTGKTIILSGRINADTTLRKENSYILKGLVYMVGNKTMTIEPGTVIKGGYSGSDVGALIITRGSKLMAEGSVDDPIVFTSASPNPQSGDWGGIILLGKAAINTTFNNITGLYQVEGGVDNANGDGLAGSGDAVAPAPVNNDNSGILRYVRIEYAGYAFQPDKEINSLTMAAVGNGTTIDHVQVAYAKDDAFEWFGGSVNCKYLIAYKTQDDDFDSDNGFSGKIQFGLIYRDSLIADISRSEAFESDNNSGGTTAAPKTSAVFSNITAIGPMATLQNAGNPLFLAGAQIRRNSTISIYNSVFLGWPTGVLIDATTGTATDLNITAGTLNIKNTTIAGCKTAVAYAGTNTTSQAIVDWFTNSTNKNTILTNVADARVIAPFSYTAFDPTPFGNSSLVQTNATSPNPADFSDAAVADAFFNKVNFRGAIAPAGGESNWWKGWTRFNF